MTADETLKNTKVRISDTVHINDQEVIVAKTIAIGPLAPGFTGVTLTIFTEDFDVDWKKVPSDIEIIAPDEMISQRAMEVEKFGGLAPHGALVDEKTLMMSMTLRIAQNMATPMTLIKAFEHMGAKGVPSDAEIRVISEDGDAHIALRATWLKEAKHD